MSILSPAVPHTVRIDPNASTADLCRSAIQRLGWTETQEVVADIWVLEGTLSQVLSEAKDRPLGVAVIAIVSPEDGPSAFRLLGGQVDDVIIAPATVDEVEGRLRGRLQDPRAEIRSRTLRMLAHDINNPLTAIRLLAEMLVNEVPEGELKQDLADMLEASDLAASLVESFSALSRLDSPIPDPNVGLLDLNAVLLEASRRPSMKGRITYRPTESPVLVRGDLSALKQAVGDMVLTGRRLSDGKGPFSASVDVEGFTVVVRVCAPGGSIPAEAIPHVRRPFGAVIVRDDKVQVAATGLAHASRTARQHHGSFDIDPHNKMCSLILRLPLADAH
jgi:signal transduction histidine kinase